MPKIDQLLNEYDLSDHKTAIMANLKNSIKLNKVKTNETDIPIGSSKIGGTPDFPIGWESPRYEDDYLTNAYTIRA